MSALYLYSSAIFIFFAVIIILMRHDSTVRKQAGVLRLQNDELKGEVYEIQHRFEAIFEYSRESIALMSLDGHFIRANKSLCELLNYSESDIQYINYFNLI